MTLLLDYTIAALLVSAFIWVMAAFMRYSLSVPDALLPKRDAQYDDVIEQLNQQLHANKLVKAALKLDTLPDRRANTDTLKRLTFLNVDGDHIKQ